MKGYYFILWAHWDLVVVLFDCVVLTGNKVSKYLGQPKLFYTHSKCRNLNPKSCFCSAQVFFITKFKHQHYRIYHSFATLHQFNVFNAEEQKQSLVLWIFDAFSDSLLEKTCFLKSARVTSPCRISAWSKQPILYERSPFYLHLDTQLISSCDIHYTFLMQLFLTRRNLCYCCEMEKQHCCSYILQFGSIAYWSNNIKT